MTWRDAVRAVHAALLPHAAAFERLGSRDPLHVAGDVCKLAHAHGRLEAAEIAADPWAAIAIVVALLRVEYPPPACV